MCAEGKNTLVIVPKNQAEQWTSLLRDRFGVEVRNADETITESAECRNEDINLKTNQPNFQILNSAFCVVADYDSSVEQADALSKLPLDLVVFDEAHRFRKFRLSESKKAEILYRAFGQARKIMLTATPMQGNVMDLWGMMQFLDDTVFPDAGEFYKRYHKKPENYPELKELLSPYIFRTLRREVKADVFLPERYVHTERYSLNDGERLAYTALEKYLSKPQKAAFPDMDGYELTLMLTKLFSSSLAAFGATVENVVGCLEKMRNENSDKFSVSGIDAEIAELNGIIASVAAVPSTSKAQAFLAALNQTLQSLKNKGAPQKAVVFTEYRESAEYIAKLLDNTHYGYILFKGAESVEEFRNKRRHVLICTDAAAEGFNIQFASAVFNFDMPWNMQKIEQRIGRVHRIGQTSDVLAFNFICPDNFADARFCELIYKRTTAFDGILGASDLFVSLGDESGVKAVADIVATGRNAAETASDFEALQSELSEIVTENKEFGDNVLFNTFDASVQARTKNYASRIKKRVAETKELLWRFMKYAVKPYGTAQEKDGKRVVTISKSLFKSKKIESLFLYMDAEFAADRSALITPTNRTVKELLWKAVESDGTGRIEIVGDKYAARRGVMALYNISGHASGGWYESETVLLTDDGELDGAAAEELLLSPQTARNDTVKPSGERLKSALTKAEEAFAVRLKENGDPAVKAETRAIERRRDNALSGLEREIRTREVELKRLSGGEHAQNHGGAFGKNQLLSGANDELKRLKEEEFKRKAQIKKDAAEAIKTLTANTYISLYTRRLFLIEFVVKTQSEVIS